MKKILAAIMIVMIVSAQEYVKNVDVDAIPFQGKESQAQI